MPMISQSKKCNRRCYTACDSFRQSYTLSVEVADYTAFVVASTAKMDSLPFYILENRASTTY